MVVLLRFAFVEINGGSANAAMMTLVILPVMFFFAFFLFVP